tara:strand:- start:353 stop:613 length:261 start_codon:yes stop_codon:yes gene_type:complete
LPIPVYGLDGITQNSNKEEADPREGRREGGVQRKKGGGGDGEQLGLFPFQRRSLLKMLTLELRPTNLSKACPSLSGIDSNGRGKNY